MPDAAGAAARHLLLPQEAACRRLMARLRRRYPAGPEVKATLERYFGPDGLVYHEASLGDIVTGGLAAVGGTVLASNAGHGAPETAGMWLIAVGALSGAVGVGRSLQAYRAARAFRRAGRSAAAQQPRR